MKHIPRAIVAAAVTFAAIIVVPASMAAQGASTTVDQINTECNAIQDAVMALKPVHLAFVDSNWKVISDSDYAVAERTRASVTLVDVWKQGDKYAWIHSHTFDSAGNQRATQLCFRQTDGTLERAKQATSVPKLSAASAQTAYYAANGDVVKKTALFEVNDPAIAKQVSELPYYSALP